MHLPCCSRRLQSITALWIFCITLMAPWSVYADAPPPLEQRGSQATPAPEAIDNLEDVQKAVVRIEAVGVFRDPSEGMTAGAGSGSGFIIDPEGHVVTNNHVVTGAAYLKVYVEGKKEPVNARIVGVSECADLAVIDLQGRNYPYLTWYEGPIRVGLDVYAAGFPLGDPEYTLTRGIVSKARADGRRSWASVEGVIEHDANINPGNSGGPLVTTNGQVVGVNYSYSRATEQYHAIGRDNALEVIEELLQGRDVDSIGINGEAFVSQDGEFSGIWVSSVASGSLADQVGMLPGDIILSMENLPLATDGTMATYCDILRSRRANAVTAIEVLRLDTGEVLTGQLNGRPLQVSVTLGAAEEPSSSSGQAGGQATSGATYDEFVRVSDAQGILAFDVPAAWKDVQEGTWTFNDETVGVRLDVAPDLDNFYDDWGIPGVILRYSDVLPGQLAVEDLLDEYTLYNSCTQGEREPITVGDLAGAYQFWRECGGGDTIGAIVALAPSETNAFFVLLELYGVEERDFNAWDALLNSLVVTPPGTAEANTTQEALEVAIGKEGPLFDLVDVSDLSYSYVAVESPAISALLPEAYNDIIATEWLNSNGEPLGYMLTASPDIEKFNSTWTTPGILVKSAINMTEELDPDELLKDETLEESCTYDNRYTDTHEVFDRTYRLVVDIYEQCSGTDSSYAVMMAQSDPIDQIIFVDFLAVSDADLEAFATFLDSFYLDASLASEAGATSTAGTPGESPAPEPQKSGPAFMDVRDDTETISLRVPESWNDLLSEDWDLGDGPIGVAFTASPNIKKFNDTWKTPGIFIGVSELLATAIGDPGEMLDFFDLEEDCTYDDRYEYATQSLTGVYDVWKTCGNVKNALFIVLAAKPVDAESPLILLYTNLPTPEDAALFGELVTSLSIAGAVQSVQESAQKTLLNGPTATVVVESLNVRSGPGTNYNRIGAVRNGDVVVVTGQVKNCSWLQVTTPAGVEGWVSGSSQYVTLNARCADIPETKAPAPPPSSGGQSGSSQTGGANAGKGCYIFQNFVGPELTITFTNKNTGKGETFKVASNGEVEKCFDPGRYTYTLDAPPPWGSTNGELTVEAGDRFLFPITPE